MYSRRELMGTAAITAIGAAAVLNPFRSRAALAAVARDRPGGHEAPPKPKEQRLRALRDRWANRLLAHGGIKLHTSLKPGLSCGIGTVQVLTVETPKLAQYL